MFTPQTHFVLAALPAAPGLGEATLFLLSGFAIVLLTLLALAVVCAAVGALFRRYPVLGGKPAELPIKRPSGSEGSDEADRMAVIAAAVDQALGGRYRVKSVKPLKRD